MQHILFRLESDPNMAKLKRANWVIHLGLPALVALFILGYWILGILNYISPNIELEAALDGEEQEGEGYSGVLLAAGLAALGLLVCLGGGWAARGWLKNRQNNTVQTARPA